MLRPRGRRTRSVHTVARGGASEKGNFRGGADRGGGGAERDLSTALRGSELVKWQFRGVAQTGLMVPRNLPGKKRQRKQLNWSAEVLFRVLERHEPNHPLLEEAYRQATHTFLDAEESY